MSDDVLLRLSSFHNRLCSAPAHEASFLMEAIEAKIEAMKAASEEATLDALTQSFLKFAVASSGVVVAAEVWFRQGTELLRPCG